MVDQICTMRYQNVLDDDKRVSQSDSFLGRAGIFVIFGKGDLGETVE